MQELENIIGDKFQPYEKILQFREELRRSETSLVLTNGCFDLLHCGHVFFLEQAAREGDVLWIAVNSDQSVRHIKGSSRPIQRDFERAFMLTRLSFVSRVFLFDTPNFVKQLREISPDVYVKAGDYSLDTMDQDERYALTGQGTDIRFLPQLQGYSTSELIQRVAALQSPRQ